MFLPSKMIFILSVFSLLAIAVITSYLTGTSIYASEKIAGEPSKLLVVWTSGDKEVAMRMVYMYTFNAKKRGWFDEVRFLIWGPSSRMLAGDKELQDYLKKLKDVGVELLACQACADMYGVSDRLRELGVDVKYMGQPMSDMLKTGWKTVTF